MFPLYHKNVEKIFVGSEEQYFSLGRPASNVIVSKNENTFKDPFDCASPHDNVCFLFVEIQKLNQ